MYIVLFAAERIYILEMQEHNETKLTVAIVIFAQYRNRRSHGLIKEAVPCERRYLDGRWTSRHRFTAASKQAVFPFKLIDKFLNKK
jgi:hypothetical protein